MKATSKTVVSMALCALTLMSPASFARASDDFFAQASDSGKPGAATVDELVAKALTHGTVRVIVGLGAGFQPEGEIPVNKIRNQRDATARAQDDVLNRLASHTVTHVKRFKYVPYMAMEVDVAALAQLRNHPAITSIQEDVPVPPTLAQSVPLINADDAWASGFTGSGQVIAILDTGVDKAHEFLRNKVVSEACFSTTNATKGSTTVCPNGLKEQIGSGAGVNCNLGIRGCDHGTHVAGIAAGANSSQGFNGVARGTHIISIQVFSRFEDGNGNFPCRDVRRPSPCALSFPSDQMSGLDRVFALRNTYNIAAVNMSLGGGKFTSNCDTDATKRSIDNLRSVGIATIIASGNDGFTDGLGAPACISTAISVGATEDGSLGTTVDRIWIEPNDPNTASNSAPFLNLLAPGKWIYSSVPGTATYNNKIGTSMAAPHVAGAWAILKSVEPDASINRVLSALALTGKPVRDGRNNITKPRIEVGRAADALQGRGGLWVGLSQLANNTWSFNSSEWALWNTNTDIKELAGDFNGDGKTDVMKFDVPSSGTSTLGLWVGLSQFNPTTGKWFFNTTEWARWDTNTRIKVLAGDFNGDGKTDVMKFDVPSSGTSTLGLWVGLSQFNPTTGKWFFNTTEWARWDTNTRIKVLAGDFNGDGKTDVMKFDVPSSGTSTLGLWVGLSQFNPTTGKWFFNTSEWARWSTNTNIKVLAGDFNGDRKTDVMKFDVPSSGISQLGLWVGLSDGNKFNTSQWATWDTYRDMKVLVGDFNGDRKADVMKFDVPSSGISQLGLWTGLSDGTKFNTSRWATWDTYRDMKVLAGDFDNDGKTDVMKFDVPSPGVDQLGLWVGLSRFSNNAWSFNTTEWARWSTNTAIKVLAGNFDGNRGTDVMKFNVLP